MFPTFPTFPWSVAPPPPAGTPRRADRLDATKKKKKKKKKKRKKKPPKPPAKHLPRPPPRSRSRDPRGSRRPARKHKSTFQEGSKARGYPLLQDLPDDHQNHLTSGATESGFPQGSLSRHPPRTRSGGTGHHYQGDAQPGPTPATSHNNTNAAPVAGQQPAATTTLQWSQHVFDTSVQAAIRVGDWKLLTGDPGHGDWVPPQVLRTGFPLNLLR